MAGRNALLRSQIQIKSHIYNRVERDWAHPYWFSSPINDLKENTIGVCHEDQISAGKNFFLYNEDTGFFNWLQVGIYLSQRFFMCLCAWMSNMIPSVGLEVQHLGNFRTENPGNSKTCFVIHWMNSLKM